MDNWKPLMVGLIGLAFMGVAGFLSYMSLLLTIAGIGFIYLAYKGGISL